MQDCAGSFLVKNASDYLDEHYAEKLTLSELAEKMYVSQWHLSKLLNGHTKKSFCDLLNEVRIREPQNNYSMTFRFVSETLRIKLDFWILHIFLECLRNIQECLQMNIEIESWDNGLLYFKGSR